MTLIVSFNSLKKKEAMPGRKSTSKKGKRGNNSNKAGLAFPVGRCARMFRQGRYAQQVGIGAGAFAAAVLEYLACEILELAGNAAEEAKKKTIAPRHLQLALRNDEELAKLMATTTIASGGSIPNVQAFLFAKQGKSGA